MSGESTVLKSGNDRLAHAVKFIGGPQCVVDAMETALRYSFGYVKGEDTEHLPVICIIIDAQDHPPDEVVMSYVDAALSAPRNPIPLFVTPRPERFRRRGLAWEQEFLIGTGQLTVDELASRLRMLTYMWGAAPFPTDITRDAVVGSFRMMMQLDADDYHHRSTLIEDLQRCAEWDGRSEPPPIRLALDGRWKVPISANHPFARLFPNAYSQIVLHIDHLISTRNVHRWVGEAARDIRDVANNILRKIPTTSGCVVQSLGNARPHVLIIDDEAPAIVNTLGQHRVGFESDSASLGDIFHLVPERLDLEGDPPKPRELDEWIRLRVTGGVAPGQLLTDLRCADLILLDLSLNQGQESELAGFIMLEKLRKSIPDIPLVIHTGSAALGHIIQAIRNGADWYLRKDAARAYSDLASIFHDVGRRPEWRKRANRIRQERTVRREANLDSQLKREEFLYIWRCLAADQPDGELNVNLFTDGASGAVTCGVHVIPAEAPAREPEPTPLASFVAKIDRPYVMVSERERFRRLVRPLIGNRAGRIDSDVVYAGPNIAGIAYSFSGIYQARRDARTEIQPFGSFLTLSLDSRTFIDVAYVFQELLHDLLDTLHQCAPVGDRSQWIEPLFGETPKLRDSHELRLPPLLEIELHSFGDPEAGAGIRNAASFQPGDEIHLPLSRIQKSNVNDFTVSFVDEQTSRMHRAKITGEVARFLAQFRTLRPNRALSVTGRVLRTRATWYDWVSEELGDDLQWLTANVCDPFAHLDTVMRTFDEVTEERVGTIHGDLNLNNIMVDVDTTSNSPIRGALWLIDFARTRRDSLAHDFAKLEADLLTRLLSSSSRRADTATMLEFFRSLEAGPLSDRKDSDATTAFVREACQFIRRAVKSAKLETREYLATLVMNYLIILKLNKPTDTAFRRGDAGTTLRRWCLVGAAAATKALLAETHAPTDRPLNDTRLAVRRDAADSPSATRVKSRDLVRP